MWAKIDMIKSTHPRMRMIIIIMHTMCVPCITPLPPTIINIPSFQNTYTSVNRAVSPTCHADHAASFPRARRTLRLLNTSHAPETPPALAPWTPEVTAGGGGGSCHRHTVITNPAMRRMLKQCHHRCAAALLDCHPAVSGVSVHG